jgi:aspartate kinase
MKTSNNRRRKFDRIFITIGDVAMKVIKFGGSSLASGEQLKKVFNIVLADSERRIVVVSAPGKRNSDDIKVTDLLIACAERQLRGENGEEVLEEVIERYASIAEELSIPKAVLTRIREDLLVLLHADQSKPKRYIDALKASGEDNNAKLVAAFFQSQGVEAEYVSPKQAGLFVKDEDVHTSVLTE